MYKTRGLLGTQVVLLTLSERILTLSDRGFPL